MPIDFNETIKSMEVVWSEQELALTTDVRESAKKISAPSDLSDLCSKSIHVFVLNRLFPTMVLPGFFCSPQHSTLKLLIFATWQTCSHCSPQIWPFFFRYNGAFWPFTNFFLRGQFWKLCRKVTPFFLCLNRSSSCHGLQNGSSQVGSTNHHRRLPPGGDREFQETSVFGFRLSGNVYDLPSPVLKADCCTRATELRK